MTPTEDIHGHRIMEMMMTAEKPYTRESLLSEILGKYGSEARYCTCSAEGMTAEELIQFLADRGKFVGSEDSFELGQGVMCDDEH